MNNELKTEIEIDNGARKVVARQRVEVIIFDYRGNVLSIIPIGGFAELPGGGLDKDETLEEAAVREVMEETGFIIDNLQKITFPEKFNPLYIDTVKDDKWFIDMGYEAELDHVFVAKAISFLPDDRFTKSSDGFKYHFNALSDVLKASQGDVTLELTGLRKHHAACRVEALLILQRKISEYGF